ncbi:feruloyl esterase-like protein [Ophiostoma piceae UAMH 11346]|uniref:Feruloyl esterase-like protein n=1 Tax=Ophiostoma piceae (strain UAMH 11346) TaxID=1262450 RepID=S3CGX6_OPHP1|nr:feruloyl esterase-like protein [Ophiostoma piceae UAMH 11346]
MAEAVFGDTPSDHAQPSASTPSLQPSPAASLQPRADMDIISSLLTVILTTSPTPSAPSTDLVGSVLSSFEAHCPALVACSIIVVFDTYDRIGPQLRLKKGTVTAVEAAHYDTYKANVRQLVQEIWGRHAGLPREEAVSLGVDHVEEGSAEFGSPFLRDNSVKFKTTHLRSSAKLPRISFIEPEARLGFGLGVRTALRAATTPYVWVQQHDWSLATDIPIAPMLDVMQASRMGVPDAEADASLSGQEGTAPIRYICLPSVRMLRYATSAHATEFPVLRTITSTFKQSFAASSGDSLPLTPLFFWHDKTHIVSREHYLKSIFPSRLALSRGDFIEDHIGQRARSQMKEDAAAWKRWATWQYYPDEGNELCLRHLQGRTWRGEEQEQAMRDQYMERNRAEAAAAAEAEAANRQEPVHAANEAVSTDQDWVIDMPFGSDE